jgi:hypothetical protein
MTLYYSERLIVTGSWCSQVTDGPPMTNQNCQPVKLRRVRELQSHEAEAFLAKRLDLRVMRRVEDHREKARDKGPPCENCPPEQLPGGLAITRDML